MKAFKWNVWALLMVLSLSGFSMLYAQFDDEFGYEEEPEEVVCIPENLITPWDSLANKELSQDIRLLYNFGYEYYKNKSYKEALPYLWNVFVKDKGKYAKNSISKIADIYFNQGMVDSTLIACYRGLELFPQMVRLNHYAGLLQDKLGKFRCAIPHFEVLVASDSTNSNYLERLAFFYFKLEDERAIAMQEKVVSLDPSNSDKADLLAEYVNALMDEGADLEYRKKAYESDPSNLDLARSYAKSAANSGKYEESLGPLAKIISTKPTKRDYLTRAEVYESLTRYNDAISDYKALLELDTPDANIMLRISVDYRLVNNFSSAKYWIGKALQAKRGYGLAYITKGELYEASVSYCQSQRKDGKPKYEDKLVYELAYKEYAKALNDPAFVSKAKTKRANVKPFIPTPEDRFMHKNDKIKSSCYDWLK